MEKTVEKLSKRQSLELLKGLGPWHKTYNDSYTSIVNAEGLTPIQAITKHVLGVPKQIWAQECFVPGFDSLLDNATYRGHYGASFREELLKACGLESEL